MRKLNEYGIGVSEETPYKRAALGSLLEVITRVSQSVMRRSPWADRRFWIYDLNAARPYYPDAAGNTISGSAVMGVEIARRLELDYQAYLCELRQDNADALANHFVGDKLVKVLAGKAEDTLPKELARAGSPRFGYVYSDPNGPTQIPVALLETIFRRPVYKCTDLILYAAAGTLKRCIEAGIEVDDLDTFRKRINKKYWMVRTPRGSNGQQWTFLVGTNWDLFPKLTKQGFYRLDTPEGQEIWRNLSLTKKQAAQQVQPSFFR